jgi:lactoylglutathione lyase
MVGDDSTDATLRLLVLKTGQLEEVRAFYQLLGIALAPERHGQGPAHCAGQVGAVTFEVYPLAKDNQAADTTTRLGFAVDNLTSVLESLQAAGTPVSNQPKATEWGLRAVVRDPDGRGVELYQREGRP